MNPLQPEPSSVPPLDGAELAKFTIDDYLNLPPDLSRYIPSSEQLLSLSKIVFPASFPDLEDGISEIKIDPNNLGGLKKLVRGCYSVGVLLKREDPLKAQLFNLELEASRIIVALDQSDPTRWSILAGRIRNSGNISLAIQAYQRTLQLKPDCDLAHFQLADCLRQEGRRAEALTEYRTAASLFTLDGNPALLCDTLAQIIMLDPDDLEARDRYEEAIRPADLADVEWEKTYGDDWRRNYQSNPNQ